MKHPVVVPQSGESISEAYIGTWKKKSGDVVSKDEVLVDLETQKATFEIQAEQSGRIEILFPQPGAVVKPGDVIATIDDAASGDSAPASFAESLEKKSVPGATPTRSSEPLPETILSPSARKIVAEKNLDPASIQGTGKGGRILKEDVLNLSPPSSPAGIAQPSAPQPPSSPERGERRERASLIRRTIAQNLVNAQQTAAILTTFNEVDMSALLQYRKAHKESFQAKHGVSLGIVSFFALAAAKALQAFPLVNAAFTGEEIVYHDYVDISVAVSTESGLVVPVVRDVHQMSLSDFEKNLAQISERARAKKLSIPEMTGGTFTISNGGVFGSLLSTPILNMPQSAILGLHKTQERPVVVDGQIAIRPMMYLALSYDHRIIDGKEAVSFLVRIKEQIEKLDFIEGEK